MNESTVIMMPVSSIVLGARRRAARRDKVEQLAQSIQQLGLLNPITITSEGALVAGLHRLEACKHLDWEEIPASVVALDALQAELAEIDENLIRNELSELEQGVQLARRKEIYEGLYPATKQGAKGGWHNNKTEKLETASDAVSSFSVDTSHKTGKAERTIRQKVQIGEALGGVAERLLDTPVANSQKDLLALARMGEAERGGVIERLENGARNVKEARGQAKREAGPECPSPLTSLRFAVRPGDLWTLGHHRMLCGDAYNSDHAERLLAGLSPDALISDPPYGINYDPAWKKWDGAPGGFSPVAGDDAEFNPAPFLPYPTVVLFGAQYFSDKLPLGGWICWDKRLSEEKDAMFGAPFELAWFGSRHTTKRSIMIRVLHGGVVNADSSKGNNAPRYVATQKPVRVMQEILGAVTRRGEIVYDPFGGSGSTLLACQAMDRRALIMEIDPRNASVILQRWADTTGGTPCRE